MRNGMLSQRGLELNLRGEERDFSLKLHATIGVVP
ncbi:hypothetical protein MPLSOD_50084 [Mesorhizobium sp. SOD10]|nr:hypothetical protein MPLSOD_50084 [Mesorhizobium sp. SOD10]